MGVFVEKFREMIDKLPKDPTQFRDPIHASSCMATLTNATLQCMASLEEALEDAQKENERLQEMLMDAGKTVSAVDGNLPTWWPKKMG